MVYMSGAARLNPHSALTAVRPSAATCKRPLRKVLHVLVMILAELEEFRLDLRRDEARLEQRHQHLHVEAELARE